MNRAWTARSALDGPAAPTWADRKSASVATSARFMSPGSRPQGGLGDRSGGRPRRGPRLFLRRVVPNRDVGHSDRRQRLEVNVLDRVVLCPVALVDHSAHALGGGRPAAQVLLQRRQRAGLLF